MEKSVKVTKKELLLGSNNKITGPRTGTVFVKKEVLTGAIHVHEIKARGHTHIKLLF